jgi:hypothetical protein
MALSSQPVASVDVGDRHGEEDKSDGQHDDVHHGNAPRNECSALSADTWGRCAVLIRIESTQRVSPVHARKRVTDRIGIREGSTDDRIGFLYRSRAMGRRHQAPNCLSKQDMFAVIGSVLRAPAQPAGQEALRGCPETGCQARPFGAAAYKDMNAAG